MGSYKRQLIVIITVFISLFLSSCSRSTLLEKETITVENENGIYASSVKFQDIKDGSDPKSSKFNPTEIFTISALGNTASTINNSIIELHKYESSDKPKFVQNNDPSEDFAKYGLGFLVAIDWVGPIEAVVHKVAMIAKYKFKVLGASPPIPVLVNIFSKRTTIGDILRVANLQSRGRADVIVYPKTKTIELRYKAT